MGESGEGDRDREAEGEGRADNPATRITTGSRALAVEPSAEDVPTTDEPREERPTPRAGAALGHEAGGGQGNEGGTGGSGGGANGEGGGINLPDPGDANVLVTDQILTEVMDALYLADFAIKTGQKSSDLSLRLPVIIAVIKTTAGKVRLFEKPTD
jgi:hypothetical protein